MPDASEKQEVRRRAIECRGRESHQDAGSRAITRRLLALPEYAAARKVAYYVGVRDEVRTREAIAASLADHKRIAVPYCHGDELRLCWLDRLDELAVGAFRIEEPRPDLRTRPERNVSASELDLIVVPGVAFDPAGGRIGYGRGYYDRLLTSVARTTTIVAMAFDCQIIPQVPREPHDIMMHRIITPTMVYSAGNPTRVQALD